MNSRWHSVQEIAVHLGASRDTVYRWIADRKLPAHRIRRCWKFKLEKVAESVRAGKAAEEDKDGQT